MQAPDRENFVALLTDAACASACLDFADLPPTRQ